MLSHVGLEWACKEKSYELVVLSFDRDSFAVEASGGDTIRSDGPGDTCGMLVDRAIDDKEAEFSASGTSGEAPTDLVW